MNRLSSLVIKAMQSNVQRLSNPYKLTYAVTYRCNSRCQLCNIWKKERTSEFSLSDIQLFFSRNPFFSWIDITGGEVFLRPDLVDIAKIIFATQPNLYLFHLPTNGMLSEKIYDTTKKILSLNPRRFIISVSLDGPKLLHEKLRGVTHGWDRAIKTYKLLSSLQSPIFSCYFGMTVSGHNDSKIEQTYQDLHRVFPSLKRSDIHLNIAHQSNHYYANTTEILKLQKKTGTYIQSFVLKNQHPLSPITILERVYQQYIPKYLSNSKTPLPCKSLSASLFMDPNGNIYPCSMWNYPLGNIRTFKYRIKSMWNTKQTKTALALIYQHRCAHCWTPCEAYQTILGNIIPIIQHTIIKKNN